MTPSTRHLKTAALPTQINFQRTTSRPTSEQILRLFGFAERHVLFEDGREVQEFKPELTDLQRQVLDLMGVPLEVYLGG